MINKNVFLFLVIGLTGCSRESTKNEIDDVQLSFHIDTVFIETGDELIFHQYGLSHSSLSDDQKQLFNFTPKGELEVIDLDSLKLVRRIVLEKEGPLGVGQPYAIQVDPTGRLVLCGLNELRIFSPDLDSMERYLLADDALSGLSPEVLAYFNPKIVDGEFLYAIYETHQQVPQGLAIVSLEKMTVKKILLDLAARIEPFTYSLKSSGKGYEPINLQLVDDRLILSTAYANEVFIVDLESESVTVKTFHSELTSDKKPIPAKTATETINEMEELRREGEKGVKFGGFHFNSANRRFWRFSRDLDSEIGDSLVFKNVLTVFDEDFNQLAESVVPVDPFSKKFFKDGKLWSYVNVDDELGFAVITLNF